MAFPNELSAIFVAAVVFAAGDTAVRAGRFERTNSAAAFAPAKVALAHQAHRVIKIQPISALTAIRLHISHRGRAFSMIWNA
jgi:carbon starvation protein CstA